MDVDDLALCRQPRGCYLNDINSQTPHSRLHAFRLDTSQGDLLSAAPSDLAKIDTNLQAGLNCPKGVHPDRKPTTAQSLSCQYWVPASLPVCHLRISLARPGHAVQWRLLVVPATP